MNESWQKAIACWEQVKKLSPNDQDASRQINALSAAGTIKRAGLEDSLDQAGAARPPVPSRPSRWTTSSRGSSKSSSRPNSG